MRIFRFKLEFGNTSHLGLLEMIGKYEQAIRDGQESRAKELEKRIESQAEFIGVKLK